MLAVPLRVGRFSSKAKVDASRRSNQSIAVAVGTNISANHTGAPTSAVQMRDRSVMRGRQRRGHPSQAGGPFGARHARRGPVSNCSSRGIDRCAHILCVRERHRCSKPVQSTAPRAIRMHLETGFTPPPTAHRCKSWIAGREPVRMSGQTESAGMGSPDIHCVFVAGYERRRLRECELETMPVTNANDLGSRSFAEPGTGTVSGHRDGNPYSKTPLTSSVLLNRHDALTETDVDTGIAESRFCATTEGPIG